MDIKPKDRIRIKDRPDWEFPTGYKLAGAEGTVVKIIEGHPEYINVLLDEELTGFDKRIPLGFRIDAVEKI